MTYAKKLKPHEFNLWQGKPPLLRQIDIELTERCNNNCLHCCINLPENDAAAREREMSTEFVKDVIQQAADLGCMTVRFTGGEPLLRADLPELYVFTRRLGMQVILFTNARLITRELVELLARMPPGRVVEVSVYGMKAESYNRAVCCKGAFEEFWRGVSLLQEYQIPFIVKGPVFPFLKDELAEFEAWAMTLPRMDHLPSYSMNFALRDRRDNPAKNELIKKLRLSPAATLEMVSHSPLYLRDMKQFCGKFIGPPGDQLFQCGAGHGTCMDAYGKAQMCMGMRHPATVFDLRGPNGDNGAVRAGSLREALAGFFPRLREMRATNPDYLNRCARCFLKGLCDQCPAKSWSEHGTMDTPVEYFCEVAHAKARYLGLVGESEQAWEVEDWRERIRRFIEERT